MTDETPNPVGRPTTFQEEYGEKILSLMAGGLSLAAAAAELDIHRQRVYDWVKDHPEFDELVKLAKSKRQLFLERRLISTENKTVATTTIFALKNAGQGDWLEKVEHEHSGPNKGAIPLVITAVENKF